MLFSALGRIVVLWCLSQYCNLITAPTKKITNFKLFIPSAFKMKTQRKW